MDERVLLNRLREIEALYFGTTFDGEREAAGQAMQRLKERLREMQADGPAVEFRFSMKDQWERRLFVALLQRYDLQPYRYRGQRYTTVMARVSKTFVDSTLWPEFLELSKVLGAYLDDVTQRVIKDCIYSGEADVEVRDEPAALPSPNQPR